LDEKDRTHLDLWADDGPISTPRSSVWSRWVRIGSIGTIPTMLTWLCWPIPTEIRS